MSSISFQEIEKIDKNRSHNTSEASDSTLNNNENPRIAFCFRQCIIFSPIER